MSRKKYKLSEMIAQCDFSIPPCQDEIDWMNMPSVGREFGSPDWLAAEEAGKLAEFEAGTWAPPKKT